MSRRWVLEATWGGYVTRQERMVHREVFTGRPQLRDRFAAIQSLQFTDGTMLFVSVRDAKPREKVAELKGYTKLLHDAAHLGLTGYGISVLDTEPKPTAARSADQSSN